MVAGFVIGVDGGGTRSRAVAVSIEGERLGEVNGGPLNVNTTETGTFTESLDGLFQQFRDLHRLDASAAVQTVIGTASLFTSLDHGEAARLCGGLLPAERLTVVGDVVSALFGATLGAPGLLVVSGTGSIAAAMDEQGRCRTSGGLGPAIGGDPGSARWIANEVLLHASAESCNGDRPNELTGLVCGHFGVASFQELIPEIYTGVEPAKRLADFSRVIAESDLRAESFWLEILRRAGRRLAMLCVPLLAGPGLPNWPGVVHASGSVLTNNATVRSAFEAELATLAKRPLSVESPRLPAAEGAALMALKALNPSRVAVAAARLAKRES